MSDPVHAVTNAVDHNRYTVAALVVTACLVAWAAACKSTTPGVGLDEAGQVIATASVDRPTLARQIQGVSTELAARQAALDQARQTLVAQGSLATADLDAQDQARQQVLAVIGDLVTQAATGGINPASAIAGALTVGSVLLAGGTLFDNRRKDAVITQTKAATQPATTTQATAA